MAEIRFNKEEHRYYLEDKPLISCTQLMRKHGLAPDYSNVSKLVLEAKARYGSLVHEEIENYINTGAVGFSKEVINFINYLENNKDTVIEDCEFLVYNDVVAGRADLLIYENNELIIADIKTTASVHKSSVSWQLSIYAQLYQEMNGVIIEKGRVYHFDKNGDLKVIDLDLKPSKEVERLFDCERNNIIYHAPIIIDDKQLALLTEIEKTIKFYETKKKEAEEQAKDMREALLKAMQENGRDSLETDTLKVTYVAPTTRTSIDSVRLKKDEPTIYELYSKTSKVKASLRITIKEEV